MRSSSQKVLVNMVCPVPKSPGWILWMHLWIMEILSSSLVNLWVMDLDVILVILFIPKRVTSLLSQVVHLMVCIPWMMVKDPLWYHLVCFRMELLMPILCRDWVVHTQWVLWQVKAPQYLLLVRLLPMW